MSGYFDQSAGSIQPSHPRTLDEALSVDVPYHAFKHIYEKHVKQTFLVDTYHRKLNHGFRKNHAILQMIDGHV